ncbi:MAG: ABC transporter ATP-binding protein [Actinomycetaceae bacterium]|nr:ABC transporter ATP-binding protein [Actinomycetaceae bacterium]
MSEVLRTSHLTKIYGSGALELRALDDVSLSFPPGHFAALLGPSGSGKSTFMHVVAGLDSPTSGTVTIGDMSISGASDKVLTRVRRERIGFVFQSYNLLPAYAVHQNITLPLKLGRRQVDEEWFESIVETLGISTILDKLPEQLSGGQQQRVAVARALLGRPAFILADEPTGSLDSATSMEVLELLRMSVREFGQTVIMATHDLTSAAFSERVILISDGKVAGEVSDPTPRSVLAAIETLNLSVGMK